MGQAHQGVVDVTCCEWMTFKMRKGAAQSPNLSHTQVRVMMCDQVRDTEKMCVRQSVPSSPPVACTTFAKVCTRNL